MCLRLHLRPGHSSVQGSFKTVALGLSPRHERRPKGISGGRMVLGWGPAPSTSQGGPDSWLPGAGGGGALFLWVCAGRSRGRLLPE